MRVFAVLLSLASLIALQTAAEIQTNRTQTVPEKQTSVAAAPLPRGDGLRSLIIEGATAVIELPGDGDYDLIVSHLDPSGDAVKFRLSRNEAGPDQFVSWSKIAALHPRPCKTPDRSAWPGNERRDPDLQAEPERTFWVHTTNGPLNDPLQYTAVRAKLFREGIHTRVYLDCDHPPDGRIRQMAAEVISELDEGIVPECTRRFGPFRDVDGDGKVAVLLTPWLDRLQNGRTSLHGFVRGSDFDRRIAVPLGNAADLIYLNSEADETISWRTLLAHEYFHLLTFSLRVDAQGRPFPAEDDWLNEAEAHVAENLLGGDASNLRHRLDAFTADPAGTPLVVRNYYRSGLWRDDRCRGAAWLFLRWCTDRFGDALLAKLNASPYIGVQNLEYCTGVPFPVLKQRWAVAMLRASRGEAMSAMGYRYFASTRGAELFGADVFARLAVAQPHLDEEDFEKYLAPTGTLFVELDRSVAGPLRVTSNPPTRLQLTLVPRNASLQRDGRMTATR